MSVKNAISRPFCYETLKFNTIDGDLHKGQYAIDANGNYLVRKHPENNYQWIILDPYEVSNIPQQIQGLTQVQIIPNEHCYYYEYKLDDGSDRIVRFQITGKKYKDYEKSGASVLSAKPKPTKKQIDDIKKEDDLWQ